jgi:TIR domain
MNVFISYRRNDTQDLAGRIADRIRVVPQVQRVFLDVDGIDPGTDFAAKIRNALAESSVCIIVIGPHWRGAGESGAPRIFDEHDFVRREAAAALLSENKILPVLANGATMPAADELPADLQRLAAINAVSIRHMSFDRDMDYLIDVLLSRKKPGALGAYLKQHPGQAAGLRALLGALASCAVLIVAAAAHRAVTGRSLDESLGGPGPVWLTIVLVLAAGIAFALQRRR